MLLQFGEDPFLCGEMTYSAIMGVEGDNISAEDRCASSLKHYIGYPATEYVVLLFIYCTALLRLLCIFLEERRNLFSPFTSHWISSVS